MIKLSSYRSQRGIATVEMAFATPVLLVFLLLTAEFTRVFYEFNTLTKSVRDAARLAASSAYDGTNQFQLDGQTIANARNLVVYANVNGSGSPLLSNLSTGDVTVSQVDLGTAPLIQEHVEVTASYEFQPLSPVLSAMGFLSQDVGMNFTLVASSTMRAIK